MLKSCEIKSCCCQKKAAFVSVLLSIFNISNSYNFFCVCVFLYGAKLTDALEMKEIANDFIGQNERRMQIFDGPEKRIKITTSKLSIVSSMMQKIYT